MKKLTILVFVILALALNSYAQDNRVPLLNDVNPHSLSLAPIAGVNDYPNALYDLLRNYNVDSLIGTVVSYGVCWTGTYYVTGRFSANMFNRMNTSWVKVDSFAASGAGTGFFRDLAYANGKIWGSPLSNTIYGINPNTGVMEKTIVTAGASIRAICWDPVRKGFWCGTNSFTGPLVCYDTNGVAIPGATITMPASGCYSASYDDDPAGPFLWIGTDQTPTSTTGTALLKYNATTLAQIGTPINLTIPLTTGAPLAAGGGEVTTTLIPGKRTYVGMVQGTPDRVFVVDLGDVGAPVPSGTWTEQTSGLTSILYSVSAVNDDVAWVSGAAGKVLRTTNKGVTWANVSGTISSTLPLYNIFAWDANTAVVTGTSSAGVVSIYNTTNGGTTWNLANTHTGFGDDMFMTDANTAYYIGDPIAGNWDLLKSTNGGANWGTWSTLATTNTSGTYNNAFFQQGTQIWFPSVGQSQMLYSSNMGANWVTQTMSLSEITATCFTTPTRGLAGGSSTSPGLLSTTDAGTTWTALTNPYPANSISGIAGAQTTWWVAQQGTGISISTNDGATFTSAYTAPAGSFYHLTKSRSGATLWAVRSNGGISRYGQPIIGINPISTETPSNYSVSQNYPNPFNPTTKINFALPKSGLVTLKIYDITGKEVATLVNEVKNVGTYSVDFNASNLSSGMYFYKISVNGFSEVKKMSLIK